MGPSVFVAQRFVSFQADSVLSKCMHAIVIRHDGSELTESFYFFAFLEDLGDYLLLDCLVSHLGFFLVKN